MVECPTWKLGGDDAKGELSPDEPPPKLLLLLPKLENDCSEAPLDCRLRNSGLIGKGTPAGRFLARFVGELGGGGLRPSASLVEGKSNSSLVRLAVRCEGDAIEREHDGQSCC